MIPDCLFFVLHLKKAKFLAPFSLWKPYIIYLSEYSYHISPKAHRQVFWNLYKSWESFKMAVNNVILFLNALIIFQLRQSQTSVLEPPKNLGILAGKHGRKMRWWDFVEEVIEKILVSTHEALQQVIISYIVTFIALVFLCTGKYML